MTVTDVAAARAAAVPSWRPFRVQVSRLQRLCPSFVRVTFRGGDLDQLGHDGPDQRIKVYLPHPGHTVPELGVDDWYARYREADPATRGAVRTYTIRAVRPEQREVDIDFVMHGDTSPASAFAINAAIGQEVALIGPNRLFDGDCQGYEWKAPAGVGTLLLAGDETAVPAIGGILESLARTGTDATRIHTFIEVPELDDRLDLAAPSFADIEWLPRRRRDGSSVPHGSLLVDAVRSLDLDAAPSTSTMTAPGLDQSMVDTVDIDLQILWEIADAVDRERARDDLYAWVAGEAGAVKEIRRYLVRERGVDRSAVSFMGYWKLGRSEG